MLVICFIFKLVDIIASSNYEPYSVFVDYSSSRISEVNSITTNVKAVKALSHPI